MKRIVLCFVLCTLFAFVSASQTIPNGGFETWSGGNPTNWLTNNLPPTVVPVTQSSSFHTGSSALQGTETLQQGNYRAELDANSLTTGTYFYRLQAGAFVEVKRMTVLK